MAATPLTVLTQILVVATVRGPLFFMKDNIHNVNLVVIVYNTIVDSRYYCTIEIEQRSWSVIPVAAPPISLVILGYSLWAFEAVMSRVLGGKHFRVCVVRLHQFFPVGRYIDDFLPV